MGLLNVNMDLIGRGGVQGEMAAYLMKHGRMDLGLLKPFYDEEDGKSYVTIYKGGPVAHKSSYITSPINTNATLRRDEWKQLDEALLVASRYRLGGIDDLIAKGLTFNLGNAMGTTVLEWHDDRSFRLTIYQYLFCMLIMKSMQGNWKLAVNLVILWIPLWQRWLLVGSKRNWKICCLQIQILPMVYRMTEAGIRFIVM
jgi:hypothetical protein